MARKCLINKSKKEQKFKVREYTRCSRCGRSRAYMRHFGLCRLCFRQLSLQGEIPGIVKASW